MIVWLASYPRSGNTLLRSMLRQGFGLRSFSMYDDRTDLGAIPEIRDQTGHELLGSTFAEFYERERDSPALNLVKTHGPPLDSGRAIYIVRDGRSAIVSWYNMLINLRKRTDVSMIDLIFGRKVAFGDWSQHLRAWNPRNRPQTLLLNYGDLLSNPESALNSISEFVGCQRTAEWRNDFDGLHQLFPQFFHRGSDEKNIAQMTGEEQELYWSVHGQCMHDFGFEKSGQP